MKGFKEKFIQMKKDGYSYNEIAKTLNISEGTVKSIISRETHRVVKLKIEKPRCKNCGKEIEQVKGKRAKVFCSDKCRLEYWFMKNAEESICKCCGSRSLFPIIGLNKAFALENVI